jgi:molybdopterin converting factor small subunit
VTKAHVKLPVGLAGPGGPALLECEGDTVREALVDCIAKEPRLQGRIFRDDGGVWAGIFLNGRNIRQYQGMETSLSEGDEIRILPPIAGG